jgi:putative ATPase
LSWPKQINQAFSLVKRRYLEAMDDLFGSDQPRDGADDPRHNLAARMRPHSLDTFFGQGELLSPGKLLRRLIESNRFSALLFHGPPGTGKTSLARIIAHTSTDLLVRLNAVEASVADLRKAVKQAEEDWRYHKKRTLVLIDEIHRFNKSQQDALLPHVEEGTIRLIGATTQNPFFSVNPALLSRMQIFEFQLLSEEDILHILSNAIIQYQKKYPAIQMVVTNEALTHWARVCEGDARRSLNALDLALCSTLPLENTLTIDLSIAEESIQKKAVIYDRSGDGHYDTLSAFIKTIRGSEPDSALYLLAQMLAAGEDIRMIARRLVISAAEDIGMADPQALILASSCQQAVEAVGMPEARILLAEATVYLATAPKSNASYLALEKAAQALAENRTEKIPSAVKDASYAGAKKMGHGQGYAYAHDFEEAITPEKIFERSQIFYSPTGRGYEKTVKERLERWAQIRREKASAKSIDS